MILCVNQLSKRFGGVSALRDVSFEIAKPGVYGILGDNGSGKTTLFDIICGFKRQDMGSISLFGKEISSLAAHRRGALGLGLARTFQTPRYFPTLSVLENVITGSHFSVGTTMVEAIWSRKSKDAIKRLRPRALEFLSSYGLEAKADTTAQSLSFGQKKRLEVVRALLSPAKVFLFDEPFAGIDERSVKQMADNIRQRISSRSETLLIIDHRREILEPISDGLFALESGDLHAHL